MRYARLNVEFRKDAGLHQFLCVIHDLITKQIKAAAPSAVENEDLEAPSVLTDPAVIAAIRSTDLSSFFILHLLLAYDVRARRFH